MRWTRYRADVRRVVDALRTAIFIVDSRGQIVHETPACGDLLQDDGEPEAIRAAVVALVESRQWAGHPCSEAGADGMEAARGEIRTATRRYILRASLYGGSSPELPPLVLVGVERVHVPARSAEELSRTFALTRAEARVALLLASGLTNAEVAQDLRISPHTARRHTERVLQKLGVRSRSEVVTRVFS